MEFLKLCFYILLIIVLFFLCYVFPFKYNSFFSEKYGKKAWNWIFSVIIAIFMFATLLEKGNTFVFVILLLITLILSAVAGYYAYFEAVKVGADKNECILAALTQILSAFGILFTIIIVFDYWKSTKRRKRKL